MKGRFDLMANFKYKKTETINMKIAGVLDINENTITIDVDGEEKHLTTLLSDFVGSEIEINVKTKNEEELDEPSSDDE